MVSETEHSKNLTFREVKQAARGGWRNILISIGVAAQFLTGKHGPCPMCGGTDRFRFADWDGDGGFLCNQCGSGDGFELASRISGKKGRELLTAIRPLAGNVIISFESNEDRKKSRKKQCDIDLLVAESLDVEVGDPVWRYLTETRRIALQEIPRDLRYCPSLEYCEQQSDGKWEKQIFPAMLDLITDLQGNVVGIQRHYLTVDGQKAPVAAQKKMMPTPYRGATKGASVKLADPSEVLGLAEGVETALACWAATGIPTWAATSAPLLVQVDLPAFVEEIVIFADNDKSGTGQAAAQKLANRLIVEGKRVKIIMPPNQGKDWADIAAGGNLV